MEIKEKDIEQKSGFSKDDENKRLAKQEVKKISKLLSQETTSSVEYIDSQDSKDFENKEVSDEEMGGRIMTALDSEVYKRRLTEKVGAEKAKKFLGELGLSLKEENIHELNKLIDSFESEKITDPEERNDITERARGSFMEHIGSSEYLQKLTREFNDDSEAAKKEQEKRLKLVNETPIDVNVNRSNFKQRVQEVLVNIPEFNELSSKEQEAAVNSVLSEKMKGLYVDHDEEKGIAVFEDVVKKEEFEGVVEHEMVHSSTEGKRGIPQKTIDILEGSFIESHDPDDKGLNDYLRSSHERLVRKQLIDKQLEEYGIKEYGEKFTEKHHEALMLLFKLKGLSFDADQFIRTTDPDPEAYKQIFNEIAAIEDEDLEEITA